MKMNFKKKTISLLVFTMILSLLCTSFHSMNVYAESSNDEVQSLTNNQIAYEGGSTISKDKAVTVSKTIAKTDTENIFDITLKVTTSETIENLDISPDAAVVLVMDASGSMKGDKINAAKEAAKTFIDSFASASANVDATRKMGIVQFDTQATVKTNLTDVSSSNDVTTLKNAITNLNIGKFTNIEDGLTKARAMLNNSEVPASGRYILLLSDGVPTCHNTSNDGVSSGGSDTKHDDHNNVYNSRDGIADTITKEGTNIYSVYLGNEKDTIDCKERTCTLNENVVNWLKHFSTEVYNTTNADELAKIFEKISQIITIYADAWRVTDPMGDKIVYQKLVTEKDCASFDKQNNLLKWDLRSDTSQTDGNYKIYTLKYRVKLDNVSKSPDFDVNKSYLTNGDTVLDYFLKDDINSEKLELKHINFKVPSVKGYLGTFEFTKNGSDTGNKGLAGAKFLLKGDENVQELGFKSIEVESGADGKVTFENIPSGYTYTLEEIGAPTGYVKDKSPKNVKVNYGKVTIDEKTGTFDWVNTASTTQLTVKKEWVDNNNQDGKRPDSVSVQLKKDGTTYGNPITLNSSNRWTNGWKDLPVYESGNPIKWTVEEKVDDYTTSYSEINNGVITITNTHTPETTSFSVEKQWDDSENQDGKRPVSVKVQLMKNNEYFGEVITLDSHNEWKHTWDNLPKYEHGDEISWNVEEINVPEKYAPSFKDGILTNTYTTEMTSLTINKIWNDENDIEGFRPKSINVNVYKNGELYTAITLGANDKGEWKKTVDNLPKYDNGQPITWTINERDVARYNLVITENEAKDEFTITNTHKVTNIIISGKKTWDDANNQDGIRPEYITVNLLANGEKIGEKKVSADDNWEWNFNNLVKYRDGKEIQYTMTENKVDGYESVVNGYDITNSHKPETTSLNVLKVWNDSNDKDKIRPENVVVELYANDTATGKTMTLDEANNWSSMFEDLDKYIDGKEVKYTVKEKAVEGYEAVYSEIENGTISITNTHVPVENLPKPDVKPPVTPPKQDTNTTTKPTTGDNSQIMLWLSILTISGVVLVITKKIKNSIRKMIE